MDFRKTWQDQAEAAEGILDRFGLQDALGYIVGEKFLNALQAAGTHPEVEAELPRFAAAIRELFSHEELAAYLSKLEKKQSVQDKNEDWVFDSFADAELDSHDVIDGAEQLLALERAKELLL